jgi:hypothetical protein
LAILSAEGVGEEGRLADETLSFISVSDMVVSTRWLGGCKRERGEYTIDLNPIPTPISSAPSLNSTSTSIQSETDTKVANSIKKVEISERTRLTDDPSIRKQQADRRIDGATIGMDSWVIHHSTQGETDHLAI